MFTGFSIGEFIKNRIVFVKADREKNKENKQNKEDKENLINILEGGRSSFSNRNKKFGNILGDEEYENN